MFSLTSRYHGLPTATHRLPDGREVTYVLARPLPNPAALADLRAHTVRAGERLDQVAAAELGDPEQFWRLADAHRVLDPVELVTPGRRLRVTLPAGLPGASGAMAALVGSGA
jgi:hypothetical protein